MVSDFEWMKRMLSHNVRMPLSIITGYGELLRQGLLTPEEQACAISDICDNVAYINDLLRMVLEDGVTEDAAAERVDLAALLERTSRYVSEAAKKTSVEITVRTEAPQMYVYASPLALMRIVYQLFENAVKYMEDGGSIMVQAYYVEGGQVLLVFKDNGRGLPEKEMRRVFEKGFRGSNSAGKKGSGQGLAEIRRIVERYGGSAGAISGEDMGFSVFLLLEAWREKGA